MRLSLDGVSHRFDGGAWLYRGITATFEPGRVYALVGPSGSGKSTLLGILAGHVEPREGGVTREGISSLVWVFQHPIGVPRRTAVDHVMLPLLARGARVDAAREEAGILLDRVGLAHRRDAPYAALSGGEAQRLMIARAVGARPSAVLLDEPTAQLDRGTAGEVAAVIGELAGASTVVVVATHDELVRAAASDTLDLGVDRTGG